jgi:hypothetical protein
MISEWVTEAELEVIRWYRSLNKWQTAALNLWLETGDDSQLIEAFSLRYLRIAA